MSPFQPDAGPRVPLWSQRRRILIVLALDAVLIAGLVVAGILAHANPGP